MIALETLIDLSVEENIPPDYHFHHQWEIFARWQLDALIELGMQPHHYLLDIGCGPMRLGHLAVPYLEEGHYFGVDRYEAYLSLGRRVMEAIDNSKDYDIRQSATFDFESFGPQKYDYAIAQSVLTHLSDEQIRDCVDQLTRVMAPGGVFLFTFWLGGKHSGFLYDGTQPMIRPQLKNRQLFEELAEQYGITFERSSIEHPTQLVGILRF